MDYAVFPLYKSFSKSVESVLLLAYVHPLIGWLPNLNDFSKLVEISADGITENNGKSKCNGASIMLQAASIYTKGEGGHWKDEDMIAVMLEVSRISLKMLGKDIFGQLSKKADT